MKGGLELIHHVDGEIAVQEGVAVADPFRELQRQLNGAVFERTVLPPPKLSTPLAELHSQSGTHGRGLPVEFIPGQPQAAMKATLEVPLGGRQPPGNSGFRRFSRCG